MERQAVGRGTVRAEAADDREGNLGMERVRVVKAFSQYAEVDKRECHWKWELAHISSETWTGRNDLRTSIRQIKIFLASKLTLR